MPSNKKNIAIIAVVAVILITALVLALTNRRQAAVNNLGGVNAPAGSSEPEFLSAEEKAYFKLDNNVKAQVLNRDASGTPTVYKLIYNDYDVVANPSQVAPISPRSQE